MTVQRLSEADVRRLDVTVDIPTAGRAFGIGRRKSYELAATENGFPCEVLTLGSRRVVTKTALLRALGYETAPAPGRESAA